MSGAARKQEDTCSGGSGTKERRGEGIMSAVSDKMRKEWKENDAKRDAGLTTPEDVVRFDDLQYSVDTVWNLLDVYRPKNVSGKLPVIVNIHGGGWVYGDKELYQFYCMSLAQRNFAVVNFTYRLAPEVKFPAALIDTNEVIAWMYENQEKYGLDMEHVFLVGDSAGGHLAGLYSAICTSPGYAEHYHFKVPHGFVPTAVALNCGAYVLFGSHQTLSESQDDDLIRGDLLREHGSERERALLNVPDHVTGAYPPVYLMTAVGDFCRPQASFLEEALKKNGVYYEFRTYGSEEDPLYHVFHVTVQEPQGQRCNDEECDFFRRMMNRKKSS